MSLGVQVDETVCLGRHVEIRHQPGQLQLLAGGHELEFDGSVRLLEVLAGVRRRDSARSLAISHALPVDVLVACLNDLNEAGMLVRLSAEIDTVDVDEYLHILHRNCEIRARESLASDFWKIVLAGEGSDELITGWGIEFYHFVGRSNEYMPLGVAQANLPPGLRLEMARHCVEESDHGRILLAGLQQLGIPPRAILRAPPLPTTDALVNFLTELASSDTYAYLATFAVMQQYRDRPDVSNYVAFRDQLKDLYPTLAPLFEAIHAHSAIDDELDHDQTVFDVVVRAGGMPSQQQRRSIATGTRRFSDTFNEFFNGILYFYGSPRSASPRRPLRYEHLA